MATATERRARNRETKGKAAQREAEAMRAAEVADRQRRAAALQIHDHEGRGENDTGTPARFAKGDVEVVERFTGRGPDRSSIGSAARILNQRPVDTLLRRGNITRWQHAAAERLLGDYRASGMHRSPTGTLEALGTRVDGGKRRDGPLAGLDAWKRLGEALASAGAVGQDYLRAVVLDCLPTAHLAASLDHDPKYAVERLREALNDTAEFYGIPAPTRRRYGGA